MVYHPIPALYDENSKILILGSFPSVMSRNTGFFYGHKQNRFWKIISEILGKPVPSDIAEKKKLLLENRIAVWDVIASCEITGSSDVSIKSAKANDITPILNTADIKAIFTNGRKASSLYRKLILPKTGITDIPLPSTSPANASFSSEKLITEWGVILNYIAD